ncbi:MAG: thioredoxin family protein [Cyclobacteriaceae bacterium]|nr:thioredoxin family protein [Cyclobacteriaceae bacterium]
MITVRYLNVNELVHSFSYNEFIQLVENLSEQNRTTGPDQSEKKLKFTLLNHHRLKRINKTLKLELDTLVAFQNFQGRLTWLVIVEAWCGDVAQNLPYINAMSQLNKHIDLKLILKSDYPEIMEQFLTEGTESIPKLICINREDHEVLGTWGSRPAEAKQMVSDFKINQIISKAELLENIQKWYNLNKGMFIQQEFRTLLLDWQKKMPYKKEKIE